MSKENLSLTLIEGVTEHPLPMLLSVMLTGFKEVDVLALNLL